MNHFTDMTIMLANVTLGGSGATTAQTTQAAETPAAETAAGGIMSWLPMIAMYGALFFLLWFFMMRPQRKKAKEAKAMRDSMKAGENVITNSGFYGTIVAVGEDSFLVEFGEGKGVRIWVRKEDILGVKTPVTTPPPVN